MPLIKSVLISIRPQWVDLIASGKKTLELRLSYPKLEMPFNVYIYRTAGKGWRSSSSLDSKVVGEFTCDYIVRNCELENAEIAEQSSCVSRDEINRYGCGREVFGWHISNLKMYKEPKLLGEFYKYKARPWEMQNLSIKVKRAPQSWAYVEEEA